MPLIVNWPARVKPGVSDALMSQVDLYHSLAGLVGVTLPDRAAPDSLDHLPALLGESPRGREHVVEGYPYGVALRQGKWKLIPKGRRAAWATSKHAEHPNPLTSPAPADRTLLFDLDADPRETTDVADEHPDVVRQMMSDLEAVRAAAERPGAVIDGLKVRYFQRVNVRGRCRTASSCAAPNMPRRPGRADRRRSTTMTSRARVYAASRTATAVGAEAGVTSDPQPTRHLWGDS